MKVRHGFVSNSSSTSFIVALDKPFTSVEDCQSFFNCYHEQALLIYEGLKLHTFITNTYELKKIIKEVFEHDWSDVAAQLTDIFVEHNIGKCMGIVSFSDNEGNFAEADLRRDFRDMVKSRGLAHIVVEK